MTVLASCSLQYNKLLYSTSLELGAMSWKINARTLTGKVITVQVSNPESSSVLDVKKLIEEKDASLPHYLQRLIIQSGRERVKLEDDKTLAEVGLSDNATISLVVMTPFELYIQDMNGRQHNIVVPSSVPEQYTITSLTAHVEAILGCSMSEYTFSFKGRPVDAVRHGKKLTLKDCSISARSSLILIKTGLVLNITNPKVDVCFMVDCTGSMGSHIDAVKKLVQKFRDQLVEEYKGCDLRFSFVRYTDYDQSASTRITWLDFTNSQSGFKSFVGAIRADGGGDTPEDIMGALKVMSIKLSWRTNCCKVMIHIADAPCHGSQYHEFTDTYPNGDPAGISHDSMMAEVVRLDLQYWFGFINKTYTDKMIGIFNESLRRQSDQRLLIRQFDAVQPAEIGQAVHRSVSDSIMGKAAAKLAAVRKCTFDPNEPDWFSTTIIEQYGKKTSPVTNKGLVDLQEKGLVIEPPQVDICFKIAPNPFTEGTESHVYYGYDIRNKRKIILKKHKRMAPEFNSLDCYLKKLQVQSESSVYAHEFNCDKSKGQTAEIVFSPVDVVQTNGNEFYLWEPPISGKIEKFSTNSGVVRSSPHNDLLQAFSHYTWVKSGKTLLVCDLEGVVNGGYITLTDPAIHSYGPAGVYGHTDAGYSGIQLFFSTHVCESTCRKMGLQDQKL